MKTETDLFRYLFCDPVARFACWLFAVVVLPIDLLAGAGCSAWFFVLVSCGVWLRALNAIHVVQQGFVL